MKKRIVSYLALLSCILPLTSCSLFYHMETGDIDIGYNTTKKDAFVANITFDKDKTEYVIPSEINGCYVTTLGGYFERGVPSPFRASSNMQELYPDADRYYSTSEEYLYEDKSFLGDEVIINNYKLFVTLPKYLKTVKYVDTNIEVAEYKKDDKTTAYVSRYVFYFNLDSSNENFYTKEGKLYTKDDVLVKDFLYE